MSKSTKVFVGVFVTLILFLLFYKLDARTFRLWDESRLAINAASMFMDGNYFYTNYLNSPDFWNTKPHLLILLQVLSMKFFGFTEGSIRLPSAIATLLSCSLIFIWMRKQNYSIFYRSLAILVFICTRFLSYHGARAGDYEALLILWELCYCFAIFEYIQTKKSHFLWLGFMTLTLAVLTKGIAGLLFLPGIIIFAFLKKKVGIFLKSKNFYIGLFIFISCIAGYYGIHELLTPGYLKNVFLNEVGGRYFTTIEKHEGNYGFYFHTFSLINFYFLPIGLIGIIFSLFKPSVWSRHILLQYVSILAVIFFTVISFSKTKIGWYAYPLYPFIGILIAILCTELEKTFNEKWRKRWLIFLKIWMVLASITAIIAMLASTRDRLDATAYLKHHLNYQIPHEYKLIMEDINQYDTSLDFQIQRYFAYTQHHITKISLNQIHEGDWVIMNNDQLNKIGSNLKAEAYSTVRNFGIYQVKAKT